MDQFTINYGLKDNLILLNCSNSIFDYINFKSESIGIVLLNTNVKHSLINSAYNDRVNECIIAENLLNSHYSDKRRLANYTYDELNEIKYKLNLTVYNRAKFVICENLRTLNGAELLKQSNFQGFGKLMYNSHQGLKDLYEVSCPELDFIVNYTLKLKYVLGSRMMGGGFGGCTINLIRDDYVDDFISSVSKAYLKKFNIEPSPLFVNIGDGVTIKTT